MGATYKLIITIILTVCGASFQFYSFAVLNTPQDLIEAWINDTYAARNGHGFSSSALTLYWSFTVSSIAIGACFGSLLTRAVAETCGRRNGLISNGLLTIFGGLCCGIAKLSGSPELLILGRLLLGVVMGLGSGLAPMYLTEIAPIQYRGAAGTAHMIAVAFGDWFSLCLSLPQILGSESLWPLAVAFPTVPAAIMVIFLPFCPESPRYLLSSRDDRQSALKAVQFFVTENEVEDAFVTLQREANISTMTNEGETRVRDLFLRKELRTPLLISFTVMVAQQFTGAAAIFAYSSEMFTEANLSTEMARYCTLAIGISYFLCTLPSPYLIERWGRRSLSLFQLSGCLAGLVLVTLFVGLQSLYSWTAYASIGAMVGFMCIYGVGSPIPWLITSELFLQESRSAAVAFSTFVAWFFASLISTLYLPFQEAVGITYSFFPFIIVLSFCIAGMFSLLPETKNKSIEDIVWEFRRRSRTMSRRLTMILPQKTAPELEPLIEESESSRRSSSAYGGTET